LPFIKIAVDESEDLGSLFIQNNLKIKNHNDTILLNLDRTVFELYGDVSFVNFEVTDILNRLSSILVENENEH